MARGGAAGGAPRAVVLVPAEAAPPSALMRVLGRKGVDAVLSPDEPAVMVELARGPAVAVVLADGDPPQRQATRRELLAAVRRYYPKTPVWHYGRNRAGQPTLSVLGEAQRSVERQTLRSPPPRSTPQPPKQARSTPPSADESELISEEELRMLLEPDPIQDPATAPGSRRED
jgi:hypothetical protein